jgi:hypothetical protein
MKNLLQSIRPLKSVLLVLTLLFVFTHCEENVQKQKEKEIPITAISVGLKAFIGDGNASIKNVSNYFAHQYNLDLMQSFNS